MADCAAAVVVELAGYSSCCKYGGPAGALSALGSRLSARYRAERAQNKFTLRQEKPVS
jgi:hypothetical protein